jgi:hypothetical protein
MIDKWIYGFFSALDTVVSKIDNIFVKKKKKK